MEATHTGVRHVGSVRGLRVHVLERTEGRTPVVRYVDVFDDSQKVMAMPTWIFDDLFTTIEA